MKTVSILTSRSLRSARARMLALCTGLVYLLSGTGVFAQAIPAGPASVTSITQTIPSVAGVPTLLTVLGMGYCKYRLSYTRLDGPLSAPAPLLVYSSTPQNPFPMHLRILDATPIGTYTWTAVGMEGCMGSSTLTIRVR